MKRGRGGVVAVMLCTGLALAGCSAMKSQRGALQTWITDSISRAAFLGCAGVQDRAQAVAILDPIQAVILADPVAGIAALESAAEHTPVAWIWNAMHSVLDPIKSLSGKQWVQYAQDTASSAVMACRAGLSAPPPA